MAQRILILSSSTGGGHDMRARALEAWIGKCHGDAVEVRRWQALEGSTGLDRFGVALYNAIQRHCPRAHHLYFNFLEVASLHRKRLRRGAGRRFEKILADAKPDRIVSVHAHLNHAYFRAAKAFLGSGVQTVTYCGELAGGYGFSRHWVNPEVDRFIAAVPECAEAARRFGLPEARNQVGGFMLDPPFFEPASTTREAFREQLFGRTVEGPIILLGTGANGANQHAAVVSALDALGLAVDVVALYGNNAAARARLMQMKPRTAGLSVLPLPYRTDMADLLRAVDLAFIRPGSGMTSECVVASCPVIFNGIGGVMPQERITVRFMEGRGLAAEPNAVATSARAAARALADWLNADWAAARRAFRGRSAEVNEGLSPVGVVEAILR